MRTFEQVTFEQRKIGGLLYVEVYGTKDGDTYRIDTFFAGSFTEAAKKAQDYKETYERGRS